MKLKDITAAAAADAFAGTGGSVFVNSLENLVRAFVESANLNAVGAIEVIAKSRDDIDLVVGTGGAGTVAGAAGAVSLTLIETTTEAYIKEISIRIIDLNMMEFMLRDPGKGFWCLLKTLQISILQEVHLVRV